MTPAMMAVRRRLFEDFGFYAEHALKIRTKSDGVQPFRPNEAQRRLIEVIERQMRTTGKVRVVILKARQMGLSTAVGGWMFSQVTQQPAKKALVVAHKDDSTRALFDMTRRFYEQCPDILRPSTKHSSRKELVFDKLDSGYIVATAGGEGIARGETLTHAHLSELAFWPKNSALTVFNGLMDAIPNGPGSACFIESTANGMSGVFRDQWVAAVTGKSDFEPVFLPWFIDPGYRSPVRPDFEPTPAEEDMIATFGLDHEQLQFRRSKIAEKGEDLFRQEYPATAEEAFLTSGRPVFQPEPLLRLRDAAKARFGPSPDPELEWGMVARKGLIGDRWEDDRRGNLACYLPHDPHETYYLGADVGLGVKQDWSVIQVLDSKRRQAAVWRGCTTDPGEFGSVLAKLGRFYNDGKVICERNNHGISTNRVLTKEEGYPNFYTEVIVDKVTDTETTHVGFFTSEKSKPLVINELRAELRTGGIEIYDQATLDELVTYIVTDSGKMEAEKGKHDDCVIALALANHINEGSFEPVENLDEYFVDHE